MWDEVRRLKVMLVTCSKFRVLNITAKVGVVEKISKTKCECSRRFK